jgi:hypothetical protein
MRWLCVLQGKCWEDSLPIEYEREIDKKAEAHGVGSSAEEEARERQPEGAQGNSMDNGCG